METLTYKSRMHVIKELLNNGEIGNDHGGWSGDGHKAALEEVESYICEIRKEFEEYEAEQDREINAALGDYI